MRNWLIRLLGGAPRSVVVFHKSRHISEIGVCACDQTVNLSSISAPIRSLTDLQPAQGTGNMEIWQSDVWIDPAHPCL